MPFLYESSRPWWALALRGVLSILFGIAMFSMPGLTFTTLALFFGAFAAVEGVVSVAAGFTGSREGRSRWSWILGGVVSIIAGLTVLVWPGLALLTLLYVVAAWAFVLGAVELAGSIALRKEIEGEWALALTGILSILFALLLVARPATGILTLALLIGGYAVARGILEIILSFRLRNLARRLEPSR